MIRIKVNLHSEIPNNFTGIAEWSDGTRQWFKKGKRHREDGPAVEWSNGDKHWFLRYVEYRPINLNNYIILDYYQGPNNLMWYKLLDKDGMFDYPDIPGLITK